MSHVVYEGDVSCMKESCRMSRIQQPCQILIRHVTYEQGMYEGVKSCVKESCHISRIKESCHVIHSSDMRKESSLVAESMSHKTEIQESCQILSQVIRERRLFTYELTQYLT